VKVEFHRPDDDGQHVVATVEWDGREASVTADDGELRKAVEHAFRKTPVVTGDPSFRRLGAHGEVLVTPGDFEWFRAVVEARATAETGLAARFVPEVTEGGYDPAADYRSFEEKVALLMARTAPHASSP
jgi:hypothetical protein